MKYFPIVLAALTITGCSTISKKDKLRAKISEIARGANATVGVGVMDLSTRDTLTFNGSGHFPMQSVYKFHLAMAVLDRVDHGELALDQKIFVAQKDLLPNTHSPLRDDLPNADTTLTLSTILEYTASKGDNNGCDILFRLLGGTDAVNKYIHTLGVQDVSIVATEEEMHRSWDVQFTNWTTPAAMVAMLNVFMSESKISKSSSGFLWKIMVGTPTGTNRLKSLLPDDATVAHKTGYSGINDKGLTAAVNDAGIVQLPDGRQYAIAVFVSDTRNSLESSEKIIAEISKATWDYFNN